MLDRVTNMEETKQAYPLLLVNGERKLRKNGVLTMPNEILERTPVAATAGEQPALGRLEDVLEKVFEDRVTGNRAVLIGPDKEVIELPDSIFRILRQVVHYLVEGKAISLIPVNKELTTQEAADLLNVSRPFLIRLLEQGKIGYSLVGKHRRIRFDELMAYKKNRDAKRGHLLDEMSRITQEAGAYD